MKRTVRSLFGLLVAVAIVATLVWAFLPEPALVDLAIVKRGLMRVTVDEDGRTRIRERYIVSAPLAGRLLRIALDPGDTIIAKETLLATIEPRDPELLDPRAIALAEAGVRASEAALRRASAALQEARLEQADAEQDLQRAKSLQVERSISQSQLEDTRLRFDKAGESLRAARHAEDIARFELEQARAALIRSRPPDQRETEDASAPPEPQYGQHASSHDPPWAFPIHAPIDGRVLQVFQESAAVVSAGTDLLEVGDPLDLEVVVDVLSQDAVKIRPGNAVLLERWGGDRPLAGRVRYVEPAARTKTSTLGVEEQRVDVVIDLVDPPTTRAALGDGFRVEARIVVWKKEDALYVPTNALFRVGEDWAAFRLVADHAVRTMVRLGQQNGLQAEVLHGLNEGDQVIVHPSDAIEDGVRVAAR